jgi:hypothetical protein
VTAGGDWRGSESRGAVVVVGGSDLSRGKVAVLSSCLHSCILVHIMFIWTHCSCIVSIN